MRRTLAQQMTPAGTVLGVLVLAVVARLLLTIVVDLRTGRRADVLTGDARCSAPLEAARRTLPAVALDGAGPRAAS